MIEKFQTYITSVRPAVLFATSFALFLIVFSMAHTASAVSSLGELVCEADRFVGAVGRLLVLVAMVVFLWGMVKFIANAGNEEERKKGKQVMIWGIVAIFVIFSLISIVEFIQISIFSNTDTTIYGTDPCSTYPI
jgi:uncharacterized membrane protein YidH (DUF202 family)